MLPPPYSVSSLAKAYGNYGLDRDRCNNGNPQAMPATFNYSGYTYNLWTGGVAGSTDCNVFITTFSPLILSFTSDKLPIKAPNNGPVYDLTGEEKSKFSWPADGTKHFFLVYDKNGNGLVESVDEMFGNKTRGPDGQYAKNGFETLRKYDANKDKLINAADPIYHRLMLWGDVNANGISERGELFTLQSKSVRSINLTYKDGSTRLDAFGNESKESSTFDLLSGRSMPIIDYWFVAGKQE